MLFDSKSIETKKEIKTEESVFVSKYLNVQAFKVDRLKNDLPRLPEASEIFFLQTMQAFNAFTFVEYISRLQFIEELYATTYSVSIRVIEALQEMQQSGRINKINLLISDSMMKRNPKVVDAINAWAKSSGNVTVIYTWNHSKITLCKTQDNFYCIEGSGNWGENACYEQYIVANSQEAFDLRKSLFDECKIVHKIN